MKINQIIKELLLTNDTVVIPELGAFVTQYQSAIVNSADGTIAPPTKSVTFNTKIKTDSAGILENYISTTEGVEISEARVQIEDFVKATEAKIKMKGEVEIDELGVLYNDANDKIAFKQLSKESLLIQNYGMTSVTIPEANEKATVTTTTTTTKKTIIKTQKTTGNKKSSKTLKRVLIALPIIAAIVLFVVFYQKIINWGDKIVEKIFNKAIKENTDNNLSEKIDESDLNGDIKLDTSSVEIDTTISENNSDVKDNDDNSEIVNKDENKLKDENISNVTEIKLGDEYKNYYLIVGSFSSKANAQAKVNELNAKGYTAEIINIDPTKYRVSIGGFNKVDDAIAQYKIFVIKYDSKDIWMLRNK